MRHKLVWRKRALLHICLANKTICTGREGDARENFKLFPEGDAVNARHRQTVGVFTNPIKSRCRLSWARRSRSRSTQEESSRAGDTLSARERRRHSGVQHHDGHSDTTAGPGERASTAPLPRLLRRTPTQVRRVRTNVDGRLPSPQPQVNEINALFYNYSGVLQRDARPAGTSGGELVDDLPEGGPDAEQIREMAASVVASSRKIDELAAALPEIDLDQGAQLKRIAKLQEENDALEKELLAEMERAEKTLARTSAVFAAVTDAVLITPEEGK